MTKINKEDIELTDISRGDLAGTDVAYFSLPKNICEMIFSEHEFTPKDQYGVDDMTYTEGDLQFLFDADTREINEILLFPVYKEDDGFVNGGDFLRMDVDVNIIEIARKSVYSDDKEAEWVETDDTQWVKMTAADTAECVEIRLFTPDTYCVVMGHIDSHDYDDDEILSIIKSYGYQDIDALKSEYGEDWNQILLECLFEQTSRQELTCFGEFSSIDDAVAKVNEIIGDLA